MALAVEVAGKTDVGCVRANNEDNFGYDSRYGIFVVCDGMGGQAAGEVASKMGVDVLLDYFRNQSAAGETANGGNGVSGARSLSNAIQLANTTIFKAGQEQNGRSGMGSTIVAALVRGNSLAIGHVGDSRIYLVRQGTIQQLTQDHSLVMEQVRRGYITLEQAEKSEMQNIILRALGSAEMVEADDLQHVLQLLDKMDKREATVLRMRFGLNDEEPKTLKEIGERLGLTRERVRQIENEALSKLSESLQS